MCEKQNGGCWKCGVGWGGTKRYSGHNHVPQNWVSHSAELNHDPRILQRHYETLCLYIKRRLHAKPAGGVV